MKFQKGNSGKAKGAQNRSTTALKDAILLAAEQTGSDLQGAGGLTGYLTFLAKEEPRAFSTLLGKVLPMQVTGADGEAIKTITKVEIELVRPPAASA